MSTSWLNRVEIEISVMVQQCLERRIPDKATLTADIAHGERRRHPMPFTADRAREKMAKQAAA